jgi:carbonic anhydrase
VAPSIVGSIEFAAAQFGARLVVVLGHTRCGAIAATAHAIATGRGPESRNIQAITDRIAPHIEEVMARELPEDARLLAAMRANVRASASHLRHASPLLEGLVLSRRLWVVGAEYQLETGRVHFFDGLPKP